MDSKNKVSRPIALGTLMAALSLCATGATQTVQQTVVDNCDSTIRPRTIYVGKNVSCKLAFVSRKNADIITWKSIDPDYPNVKIVLDDLDAFKTMKPCDGSQSECKSGPATRPPNDNWLYTYTASKCKSTTDCVLVDDPGIIIKP